jgi:arylformamidase
MDWSKLPQTTRDALYNNSAAVKNSPQILAGFDERSAKWRKAHPCHLGVPYGPGERQKWDVFPGSDAQRPCLIHIHGGYWQMRGKDSFTFVAEGVAAHGWSCALPGYTLAPENSLTGIVAGLRGALDWFEARRRDFGIGGPLILSGWSAGGHLTAMLLDHPSVAAGLGISGIYELGPLRGIYINEKLRLTEAEAETLSPMRREPVAKPMALAYGTAELPPLVANSRDFHAWRAAAYRPGDLIPVAGADHFTIMEGFLQPDGILTKAALRLAEAI